MDIDRDPAILQRQMDEVLKSLGIGTNVVRFVIPGVDCPVPDCEYSCDRDFYVGEIYLVANQSALAIHRLELALLSYHGVSGIPNFAIAVRLALAEAYAACDVREWDRALDNLQALFEICPGDDRAHAIEARVRIRQRRMVDAYIAAMRSLKANRHNFEAACYRGVLGFHLARVERNEKQMQKAIDNLRIAQLLAPYAGALAELIRQCETELAGFERPIR